MKNIGNLGFDILVHRSHIGQLSIGGALNDQTEKCPARNFGNSGWSTRFDGGRQRLIQQITPCGILAAMYLEEFFYGDVGPEDSNIEVGIPALCYAVVVTRKKDEESEYRYLEGSFPRHIEEDGKFNLIDATIIATCRHVTAEHRDRMADSWVDIEIYGRRSNGYIEWWNVPKKDVPSHIRQHLHNTIAIVAKTVDEQFGQGKPFFVLPRHRRK